MMHLDRPLGAYVIAFSHILVTIITMVSVYLNLISELRGTYIVFGTGAISILLISIYNKYFYENILKGMRKKDEK